MIKIPENQFLTDKDKKIIEDLNDNDFDYGMVSYAERITESVERFGDKDAVRCADVSYTYNQFFYDVRKRISFLKEKAKFQSRIVLLTGKGYESIAWAHAMILSGCIYCPIDYDSPRSQLLKCLEKLAPALIITDEKWFSFLKDNGFDAFVPDMDEIGKKAAADFVKCSFSDKFAVIHTSGSTGVPKGAELDHQGIMNCLYFSEKELGLTENDCAIAVTNQCHDMSMFDIFCLFIAGGSVAVISEEERLDPYVWNDTVIKQKVTVWNSVPPIMTAFIDILEDDAEDALKQLRLIVHAGEEFTTREAKLLWEINPDLTLYNLGGPTEGTIWNMYHKVTPEDIENGTIPYGRPIPNVKCCLFNEKLELVPLGEKALMYNSGMGVVSGYIDGREKERFVMDSNGVIWYNCGDVAMLNDNGEVIYCGRKDNQVKINGKRIELDSIEKVAAGIDGITAARVAVFKDTEIVLFYTGRRQFSLKELRSLMSVELYDYMLPVDVVYLNAMPLSHNGKTDKKQLILYYENLSKRRQ